MMSISSASRVFVFSLACMTAASAFEAQKAPRVVQRRPSDATESSSVTTVDAGSRPIRIVDADGNDDGFPPGGAASAAAAAPACPPPGSADGVVRTESIDGERRIDSCGNRFVAGQVAFAPAAVAAARTIDRMTTTSGYYATYFAGGTLPLLSHAQTYFLSDGSSWNSGAGSYYEKGSYLDHVEVVGSTVRYVFRAPADGLVFSQTDFDAGEHSAQGTLGADTQLVLEATIGGTTAKMSGSVTVASNDPTSYGEPRFNYYSPIPGARGPFALTYTITSATWQRDTFDTTFQFQSSGFVDFAHPTSVPELQELVVRGPGQVPPHTAVTFGAIAQFAGGISRDVAASATWRVLPPSAGTMNGGVLTTAEFSSDRQPFTVEATYATGGVSLVASKSVLGRLAPRVTDPDSWPMYQFDERHTGYLPQSFDPESFSLRWQRTLASGLSLNPVAASGGRVFASVVRYFGNGTGLFALDAQDGETLWSQSFGSPFSINAPSSAYGMVYIQTCNHSTDTWLHAFDAESGEQVFKAPFAAQWERYYAPTVFDGRVYIDGGYYGGMYAFDAFSGTQQWFAYLPQYDQWTPGVAGDYAYAYLGEYDPGLYVFDRHSGQQRAFIADPAFDWNGWSMNLAPLILEDGDALAIHDGRLIRFDLDGRRIAWQKTGGFRGQPSVAHGVIYAVDQTRLVALNENTGSEMWSWTPSSGGSPRSPVIVTDSHVFVSTDTRVYTVDLAAQASFWSYPAGGSLALADENLYVAQANGTLVAIAAAPYSPAPPVSLEIRGPADRVEMTSTPYKSFVTYADGRVRERTRKTTWSVAPSNYATIDGNGILSVSEMLDMAQDVVVTARYTEAGTTLETHQAVHLTVSVTLPEFIERNRGRATDIQVDVMQRLQLALDRENAILRALGPPPPGPIDPFRQAIGRAAIASQNALDAARMAVEQLAAAAERPLPAPATAPVPVATPSKKQVQVQPGKQE